MTETRKRMLRLIDLETRISTLERLIDQERAERHDLSARLHTTERRIQALEDVARHPHG
jgi:chromosome segregation ATPase